MSMKLTEALKILQRPAPPGAQPLRVFLACGFTPLHLQTFLGASLKAHSPTHQVSVETGLYGDCLGSVERLPAAGVEAAAVVLEWSDFDPRLGLRQLGGWGCRDLPDILATVTAKAKGFEAALDRAAQRMPIALCLPTLPVPPVACTPTWQEPSFVLRLREYVLAFGARVSCNPRIRTVGLQRLDNRSPPGDRLDVRAELAFGFPYRLPHAAEVAQLLVCALWPTQPRKGLITDLDDTLWSGIVGEVGINGISWDLDRHSHVHALYQQMLRSLADAGVLLGVASKNDPQVIEEAFTRPDLILSRDRIFPLEVHWQAKSESVGRILRAWNIAADSVVFIDDSPLELAEVQTAYPSMECILFPRQDEQAAYYLLERLRDLFGKNTMSEEDALRRESLRRAEPLRADAESGRVNQDVFLQQAEAQIVLSFRKDPPDPRALELVNKTNQFNLNGKRYTESAWLAYLDDQRTVLMLASYKDKYGPLGKIAVLTGRVHDTTFIIDTWALSCRAFARRIEHCCLDTMFDHFGVQEVTMAFERTPRNGAVQRFLAEILGTPPASVVRLSRALFASRCPPLAHEVRILTGA